MTQALSFGHVDEAALTQVAVRLAAVLDEGIVHLRGDLGAGKTTFARALLRALGVGERVKSPTYSLIESYRLGGDGAQGLAVHHLDLYRIADPGELEWLGLADLLEGRHLLLVEWPERAGRELPRADLVVDLAHAGTTRALQFQAPTERGSRWLAALAAKA